jgi:hypothetical protein
MMDGLEAALAASIERAAAPGETRYTARHLYYELCRTLRTLPGFASQEAPWALAAGTLPALAAYGRPRRAAGLAAAGAALVGALWFARTAPYTRRPPLTFTRFEETLLGFVAVHGRPPGLLDAAADPPRVAGREPDLADYGLSRLLVCQHAALARMLLANGLHMALSCGVLAADEATPLGEPWRSMLGRTDGARVHLLHDASPEGLRLASELPRRLALPTGVRFGGLGLRPDQARRLHLFAERRVAGWNDDGDWPGLAARERAWLRAGWRAEVEAINPARLLRALRRAMLAEPEAARPRPSLRRARAVGFMTWPGE